MAGPDLAALVAEAFPSPVLQLDPGALGSTAVKRTSTAVGAGRSGLGDQATSTRAGGSQASTCPQSASPPPTHRSYSRPPARPSGTTASTRPGSTE